MSKLNREKARDVVTVPMREQQAAIESVLDMLEDCIDGVELQSAEARLAADALVFQSRRSLDRHANGRRISLAARLAPEREDLTTIRRSNHDSPRAEPGAVW